MAIRHMSSGDIYRIEGPAKVVVKRGQIYATGVVYREGQSFTVLRARRLVVKALDHSEVELVLGPGALLERITPGEEVIDQWESQISSLDPRGIVLIIGVMDVGKSTAAALIGNKALARGYRVAIVDADVGQNDLGPPTTISLTRLNSYVTHLRQLTAEKSIFLQSTSLERIWRRAVEQIDRAVRYAVEKWGVDTVVVNTDGWILDDEAVEYKRRLIETLKPSILLAIQVERELERILEGHKAIVLPPPPHVRAKSREDRKVHREMGYGRYIFPPVELAISLEKTPFCNLPLLSGVEISDSVRRMLAKTLGLYISRAYQAGDRVYAVVNGDVLQIKKVGGFQVVCVPADFERGLLVGLEDWEGFLVGLGVLRKIYYDKKKVIVATSSDVEKRLGEVKCIRVGIVRLDDSFMEVERVTQLLKLET